ncbi:MAG: hypothetical protein GY810_04490 [Aureispira sp.]|nr:hypothetical protein [Aureispira sp.]
MTKNTLKIIFISLLPLVLNAQNYLKTESVSIFKNSSAFFIKSGEVKTPLGHWQITKEEIPQALNGTLWFLSPSGQFKSIRSFVDTTKKQEPAYASTFTELLSLNNGKKVRIYLNDKEANTTIEGTIKIPIDLKKKEKIKLNLPMYPIQTDDGRTHVIAPGLIKRLEFPGTDIAYSRDEETKKLVPTIRINFKNKAAQQNLQMMYLQKGLSWKPDYLIELVEENKAKLGLRATIVNDIEDVNVKKLNLVAGVPNFKYATSLSPLVNLIHKNISLSGAIALDNVGNFRNDFVGYGGFTATGNNNNNNNNNFGGASAVEDLYYYTLEDIILKKGERGFFDVLNLEVPIEHIYVTHLKANSASYVNNYSYNEPKNPVDHTIKLKNNSKYTWTAGSAMVVKRDKNEKIQPISQDILMYTSQNDDISVKLTEAPDVGVTYSETEIKRDPQKTLKHNDGKSYYYDLITVKSEMKVQNFKKKDIRMDIKRTITGQLVESSEKWQKAERVLTYFSVNPVTDVCWETTLKAGEEKKITYQYQIYVRRY